MKLNSPFTLHTQKIKPLFVFDVQLCTLFVVYILYSSHIAYTWNNL